MRFPNVIFPALPCLLALLGGLVAGCASDGAGNKAAGGGESRSALPTILTSRWTPPEFATRRVDGERAAVLEASVEAANSLGFAVSRFDGATGRILAARRQTNGFDGARQDTLEIKVMTFAPGVAQVALVLREAVESETSDTRGGGGGAGVVASALVRDRAPYDAFFGKLSEALVTGGQPAPAPAPLAPTL